MLGKENQPASWSPCRSRGTLAHFKMVIKELARVTPMACLQAQGLPKVNLPELLDLLELLGLLDLLDLLGLLDLLDLLHLLDLLGLETCQVTTLLLSERKTWQEQNNWLLRKDLGLEKQHRSRMNNSELLFRWWWLQGIQDVSWRT